MSPILKGFLIGSSFGVFAFLFGITESMPRSIILGTVAGIAAGLTFKIRENNKKN